MARVALNFKSLVCLDQTEGGDDEVYIVVAGYNSGTGKFSSRLPSGNGHWDMNRSDEKRQRDNFATIFDLDVPVGTNTQFDIVFMEEDGGSAGAPLAMAAALADSLADGNSLVQGIADVLGFLAQFFPDDTDDWLGACHGEVINNGGTLVFGIAPGARTEDFGLFDASTGKHLKVTGDGSAYDVFLKWEFFGNPYQPEP